MLDTRDRPLGAIFWASANAGNKVAKSRNPLKKDQPGSVTVGQIAEYGLNQKGHEGGNPCNHAHLSHVQTEFVGHHRQHRPNERLKKITDKMN